MTPASEGATSLFELKDNSLLLPNFARSKTVVRVNVHIVHKECKSILGISENRIVLGLDSAFIIPKCPKFTRGVNERAVRWVKIRGQERIKSILKSEIERINKPSKLHMSRTKRGMIRKAVN